MMEKENRDGTICYILHFKNDYIVAYPFHLGFDDNLIEYYNVIPVKELDEKGRDFGGISWWGKFMGFL